MVLENELLRVEIKPKGAELVSLKDKAGNYEYMWGADPEYWAKTSPVLFPIVGALKGNAYTYQGNVYKLSRHGFARDQVFEETLLSDTEGAFVFQDTPETRSHYPFAFRLSIRYLLSGCTLRCVYEVYNPSDSEPLLFSLGGHPAFAVQVAEGGLDYNDYYLEFPDDDVLRCHVIEDNLITDQIRTVALENHRLPLRYELFYQDALVMKTLKSTQISLRNLVNGRGIRFSRDRFPFFGIWAAKNADFICLEPWSGIADSVIHNGKLEEKEGIQRLGAKASWTAGWEVYTY